MEIMTIPLTNFSTAMMAATGTTTMTTITTMEGKTIGE